MTFIEVLGYLLILIIAAKILVPVFRGVYLTFIAPLLGHGVNWKDLPKWAVVTGSTDGIGKAYAEALAKKGFNIVLISRTQEKLDAIAQDIEKSFVVKTKTIAVNFTRPDIYETIANGLEGLEIGVLVNNVGMSYEYPEFYSIIPNGEKLVYDIQNANMLSCSMMMRLVLPNMAHRKKGVIINVSSTSAVAHVPLLSVYGASKAYMDYLSQSVQAEYRSQNIIIQSVLPGFVVSNMSKLRRESFMAPTPKKFVMWALKTVGIESRTCGYPAHKLLGFTLEFLNNYIPSLALSISFKTMLGTRRAYLKKNKLDDPLCPTAKSSKSE